MPSATKYLLSAAVAAVTLLLPARTLLADTLIYTFTGVATGTITSGKTSTDFTSAAFTYTFTGNTTNITGGGGFFLYNPASGGVFTEGSYSATFTNAIIETNGNPFSGIGAFETANLFNNSIGNGITLDSNPNLLNYALNTTVDTGTVLAASGNLALTSDGLGDGFTTGSGDVVEFTGLDALSFTVTKPATAPSSVPEPSTLVLLTAGLSGAGMLRRRLLA
jgi:PEP-CTERM motif